MNSKRDVVAAAVGKKPEVVDLLDRHLGPADQAWIVCEYTDCLNHVAGRCNVYMVHDVPRMIPGRPCDSYQKRV